MTALAAPLPPPEPQFPKTCRTCQVVITPEAWAALPYCGEHLDAVWRLEFRHHICGSTLSIITEVFSEEEE